MNTWTTRIKELRRKGFALETIAKLCGISPQALSDIEKGRSKEPRGEAAVKLHELHLRVIQRERKEKLPAWGYVYVVAAGKTVKIGTADLDAKKRWHSIKSSNPDLEPLLYVSPPLGVGARAVEAAAHEVLQPHHHNGEWFTCDRQVAVDTVKHLCEQELKNPTLPKLQPTTPPTTLSAYIAQVTDARFAEMFGVSQRAACAYRLGKRLPRPDLAVRIVKETPVDFEGIYGQGASNWRQGAQAE